MPLEKWQTIALLIPMNAKPNRYGGWRFIDHETEVDVWPDTIEHYLSTCKSKHGGKVTVVDYINNRVFESYTRDVEIGSTDHENCSDKRYTQPA